MHPPAPAFYSVLPFAALLLAIALFPLFHKTEHWWEHNKNRFLVASALGLITLCYYAFVYSHGIENHVLHKHTEPGLETALAVFMNAIFDEYIPFMALLLSLYVISGGIVIEGKFVGTPKTNATIITVGALLASFIGTTGAAMLLIRPLMRANDKRNYVRHTIVFFIFVVCNTGGCLLPIGDPPLFLGYLRGVPFTWTLSLWPEWLFMNGALIAVYYLWDSRIVRQEDSTALILPVATSAIPNSPEATSDSQPNNNAMKSFGIDGKLNFLWLALVIVCVALLDPSKFIPGTEVKAPKFLREGLMMVLVGLSLWTTTAEARKKNDFNYSAIIEVAALFIGIFICMQAPVQILNVHGQDLGLSQPWHFYWSTGLLSSFLDNAPTYVVFFETARAMPVEGESVAGLGISATILTAISLGSVFMGAMTYIGNGPNFMVKAIAEKNNIRMPSFFGFMVYSCGILLPLSIVMTLIFLR